ncbi:MAG: 2-amino-4-hydroxy-6-hydroxymethyldihydropteridine diphosphokinase [Hydrogenophaga sp.]|nr:2-amino-4-hydroxy-6-hydroxymethyldihydropteridine diphosphokinase [Hydrogenophaga sp.]
MSRAEVTAFIALGANLGEPAQTLRDALTLLDTAPGVRVLKASSLYRTAPIDSSGPDYINAVAEIATTLSAPALLDALQAIEQRAGRERPYRNAPRTLDLDLLLYGAARIYSPRLSVPHPRMWERAFVLVPLAEIAPALVSVAQLRAVANQAIEKR